MEIFAAGNKYKLLEGKQPVLIEGIYFVYALKWIKSRNQWTTCHNTYNIGPHYEVI